MKLSELFISVIPRETIPHIIMPANKSRAEYPTINYLLSLCQRRTCRPRAVIPILIECFITQRLIAGARGVQKECRSDGEEDARRRLR